MNEGFSAHAGRAWAINLICVLFCLNKRGNILDLDIVLCCVVIISFLLRKFAVCIDGVCLGFEGPPLRP